MEKNNIKYSLMPIEELSEMLGYSEIKSTRNWCKENEVPILKCGKKSFIHSWMYEIAILRELKIESLRYGLDGNEIVNAIINDDKIKLAELMNIPIDVAPVSTPKKALKSNKIDDILEKFKKIA